MARRRSGAVRGRIRAPNLGRRAVLALLAVAVDDAPARQVVWRQLDADPVAGSDADEVPAHPSGRVSDQLVTALNLDLEHRVGQRLRDNSVHDDRGFLLAAIILVRLGRLRRTARTSALALELSQDS